MVISAPGQGWRSAVRSITTEVADSDSERRLFFPEYAEVNLLCAWVATVAWKWKAIGSSARGTSSALSRRAAATAAAAAPGAAHRGSPAPRRRPAPLAATP